MYVRVRDRSKIALLFTSPLKVRHLLLAIIHRFPFLFEYVILNTKDFPSTIMVHVKSHDKDKQTSRLFQQKMAIMRKNYAEKFELCNSNHDLHNSNHDLCNSSHELEFFSLYQKDLLVVQQILFPTDGHY